MSTATDRLLAMLPALDALDDLLDAMDDTEGDTNA